MSSEIIYAADVDIKHEWSSGSDGYDPKANEARFIYNVEIEKMSDGRIFNFDFLELIVGRKWSEYNAVNFLELKDFKEFLDKATAFYEKAKLVEAKYNEESDKLNIGLTEKS